MTEYHWLSAGDVPNVQLIPSVLVITRLPVPLVATATKRPLAYVTDRHAGSVPAPGTGVVRLVHVTPSGLVMTRFPVPIWATATNRPFPYVTEVHPGSNPAPGIGVVRLVQLMPSVLVIARLPVPELATATKRPFWTVAFGFEESLAKVTPYQVLSAAELRLVHVTPSGLVITRLPVPEIATATKRPLP